jgi:hypothetical protein
VYLAIAGLAVLAIVVIVALIVRRQRNAARARLPIPLIALPEREPLPIGRPSIPRARPQPNATAGNSHSNAAAANSTPAAPRYTAPAPPPAPAPVADGGRKVEFSVPAAGDARFAPPPAPSNNHVRTLATDSHAADDLAIDDGDGRAIRYDLPSDATLQFVPGRLEVIDGAEEGHEIRFVRAGSGDPLEITFGRSEGPPYRHVQLRKQTVSRNHARMTLMGATWSLTNLSATNPVVVNGRELHGEKTTVVLGDGDRIEMGEVAFRFRER